MVQAAAILSHTDTKALVFHIGNTMTADDLATEGVNSAAV